MRKLFPILGASAIALALALAGCGSAWAQAVGTPTGVQQNQSRLDAAVNVTKDAGSINEAQTTITLTPAAGQCVYLDSALLGIGSDATGATGVETFTTTNMNGLGWTFYSVLSTTNIPITVQLVGASPIKAATCGTAVTFVTPAQNAHLAFPMTIAWHSAP
jgi:hypothetical protein